jgi:hypothetical protein
VRSSGSWSGIKFQFKQSWNTDDFGAVTFAVKTDNADLDIYPYLEKTNGEAILPGIRVSDYVVGSMDGEWQVVWIPLRDLLAGATNVDVDKLLLEFSWAGNVWLDEVKVVRGLEFPLAVDGADGPYRTRVTSVMDNNGAAFGVLAYNGELGNVKGTCYPNDTDCQLLGWKKADGTDFNLTLIEYDDEVSSSGSRELFYKGHPAYDYAPPDVDGMPIVSSTNGILCLPLIDVTSGDGVWRNPEVCPYDSSDGSVGAAWSWTTYGTFYIMRANTHSTWYRHADDEGLSSSHTDKGYYGLTKTVYDSIVEQGFARVSVNEHVGYVGGKPRSLYFPHLDFAVRLGTEVVDPYRLRQNLPIGSGVLWQENP